MASFNVGDLVKKVRGSDSVGHKGWVTAVTIGRVEINPGELQQCCTIQVSGCKPVTPMSNGAVPEWWWAPNWEKVVDLPSDVTREVGAPLKEDA